MFNLSDNVYVHLSVCPPMFSNRNYVPTSPLGDPGELSDKQKGIIGLTLKERNSIDS